MVTKIGASANNHIRLQRFCLGIQSYTFSVIHRAGIIHIAADAISRLLQYEEEPHVNTVDDVRDDIGPLTESERAAYAMQFSLDDAEIIVEAVD